MKRKLNIVLYSLIAFLLFFEQANAQRNEKSDQFAFYMDVICVKSDKPDSSRLDIYTAVPYQSLLFLKGDDGKYNSD